jgi:hypothetical protein
MRSCSSLVIVRRVFLEDDYLYFGQSPHICPWSARVWAPVRVSPYLIMPRFLGFGVLEVPAWPVLAVFSFCLVLPDSFVFTRWSLPASEA